jgi:hypothetical protein
VLNFSLITFFIFIVLFLQLILTIILAIRSKYTLNLIHNIQEKVINPATLNKSKNEDIIKKDKLSKKTVEKKPPMEDENIIFQKELKIDSKNKLIEINIQADSKTK